MFSFNPNTRVLSLLGLILSDLTADTVPYLDKSKQFTSSGVTSTELGYLQGVESAIQTQLNEKQATLSYSTSSFTNKGLTYGVYKWGRFVMLKVNTGALDSGFNNYATYTVGTLDSAFRPVTEIDTMLTVNDGVDVALVITTGGAVQIKTKSSSVPSGSTPLIYVTYISAS